MEIFNDNQDELRIQAKAQITKIQRENVKNFNSRRKVARSYNVGDLVAIKRTLFTSGSKLRPHFLVPYRIPMVKGNDRYDGEKVGHHEGPISTSTARGGA